MTQYLMLHTVLLTYDMCTNLDDALAIAKEMPCVVIIPFNTEKIMAYNPIKNRVIQGTTKINEAAADALQNIVDEMRSGNEEESENQN